MSALGRRLLGELVGTALLVIAMVGSGVAAARLSVTAGLAKRVDEVKRFRPHARTGLRGTGP